MKRSEAPPPGWYPDPTGRSGLLWWDGLDWTSHHRPLPVAGSQEEARSEAESGARETSGGPGAQDAIPSANQLRSRAATQRQRHRDSEREVADAVAEARRVAKSEVDRAVREATSHLTRARDQWQPRVVDYARRAKRWLRVVAIVVVLLVALSTWSTATLQTGLLEWLGERIDAVTGTTGPVWPDGHLPGWGPFS